MDYRKHIAEKLSIEGANADELRSFIEVPPSTDMGDYALPCFRLSKIMRKSPVVIASELAANFTADEFISEVSAVNGYLNFRVNRSGLANSLVANILEQGDRYGSSDFGSGKTVCIDYSSINIAKPFHIGHLSTTVIGSSLCKIFRFLGYRVVGINHLGDYGTQFGKLIVAFKLWSSEEKVKSERLTELTRIYVKFHEEAEKNPALEDEARHYFKLIEQGDAEANKLFELFKKITLEEVEKIYKQLNVTFDSYAGESFYNDKMQPVVDELNDKGLLKDSDGAKVVELSDYGMPPCLILKSDGSSLYATRDIAAAMYRKKEYDFYKCLYVVAYQQNLHFKQVFKVIELMGREWAADMEHIAFGMVSMEDGAMSTRKGKVILLEDVLKKSIEKAREIIENKNPDLVNKEEVAKKVGTGAVIFGALCNNRIKDIVFSFDRVLNFDGETCPYIQYTVARCNSVMEKVGKAGAVDFSAMDEKEYTVVSILAKFKDAVAAAADKREPSLITRYALDLAGVYNKFYFDCRISGTDENTKNRRLAITEATGIVLKNSLALLGIETPVKM